MESLYCTHDLQKNVTALFGQAACRRAQYEYDPYGNPINISGDATGLNPFCYSSEYHDEDLGLIYYNYRHYNPTDGRWINRDPIAEQGGRNLYGFVGNRASAVYDALGMIFGTSQNQPFPSNDEPNDAHKAVRNSQSVVTLNNPESCCQSCNSKLASIRARILSIFDIDELDEGHCKYVLTCGTRALFEKIFDGKYDKSKMSITDIGGYAELKINRRETFWKRKKVETYIVLPCDWAINDTAPIHEMQHAIDHCSGEYKTTGVTDDDGYYRNICTEIRAYSRADVEPNTSNRKEKIRERVRGSILVKNFDEAFFNRIYDENYERCVIN